MDALGDFSRLFDLRELKSGLIRREAYEPCFTTFSPMP